MNKSYFVSTNSLQISVISFIVKKKSYYKVGLYSSHILQVIALQYLWFQDTQSLVMPLVIWDL